jgi:hypothetical protein
MGVSLVEYPVFNPFSFGTGGSGRATRWTAEMRNRMLATIWLCVAAVLSWSFAAWLFLRDGVARPVAALVAMLVIAIPALVRTPRVAARVVAGIIGGGLLLGILAPRYSTSNPPTGSDALWTRSGIEFGEVTWALAGALLFSLVLVCSCPKSGFSTGCMD